MRKYGLRKTNWFIKSKSCKSLLQKVSKKTFFSILGFLFSAKKTSIIIIKKQTIIIIIMIITIIIIIITN